MWSNSRRLVLSTTQHRYTTARLFVAAKPLYPLVKGEEKDEATARPQREGVDISPKAQRIEKKRISTVEATNSRKRRGARDE
jgi:hypothetical protein